MKTQAMICVFLISCPGFLLMAQSGGDGSPVITLEPTEAQSPADAPRATAEPALSAAPATTPSPSPAILPASDADSAAASAISEKTGILSDKLDLVLMNLNATTGKVDALSAEVKAMRQEMNGRFDALEGISSKLKTVESAYLDSASLSAWKTLDTSAFKKTLISGFSAGEGKIGAWAVGKGGLTLAQKDGKAFFAKYRIPLMQPQKKRILYSFKAGSASKDTVGLGLHFYVSDMAAKAKDKAFWGEGKSILVWFAKDPRVKENRASYLQIYKSDSQVNLERVFDSKMEDGFTDMDDMKVDILYDANENFILIQVNDMIRVAYKLPFSLPAGKEIAFRTVGSGCSFSDFSASTEN